MTKAIKTTRIEGDVSVGRNVAMGGDARVSGSATVRHDLKVEGWLDAPNVKGVNRGLYLTLEELEAACPSPQDGWMACVGQSSPFAAYVGKDGKWVATGGTVEISLDYALYNKDFAALRQFVEDGQTARFHAVYATAEFLEQGQSEEGGRVVFVESANRFGYEYPPTEDAATRKVYGAWPDSGLFLSDDGTVLPDKVYLSQSRAYLWDLEREKLAEVGGGGEEADVTAGFDVLDGLRANPQKDLLRHYRLMYSRSATVRLCVGHLYAFDDTSAHGTTQVLLCNYVPNAGGTLDFTAHRDGTASVYMRYYNRAAPGVSGEIPQGTWGVWKLIGGSVMVEELTKLQGAVKRITVRQGVVETPLTPDGEGNVELEIPDAEIAVDEALDEASTNPVQNRAVAAAFSGLGGKYGAALKLNAVGEGQEKAYTLSLLDEQGAALSTTEAFSGGGGGSAAAAKVVLERLTGNPTVKAGDTVRLSYKYDHVDTSTGQTTGNAARVTVTVVRGATTYSFGSTVAAGTVQVVDVTRFLGVGTNQVRVRAEVGEGAEMQAATVSWSVQVVQLSLSSAYSVATIIYKGDRVSVPYALTGSGQKTLRCYVDGVDVEDRAVTASSANGAFLIDTSALSHGAHPVQLVAELELDGGGTIRSNSIYLDLAVREEGNTAPVVAARFGYADGTVIPAGERPYVPLRQYGSYTLRYAAYDPLSPLASVEVYEGGRLVSATEAQFVETRLELRAMEAGEAACRIVCGGTEYGYALRVEQSGIDLAEPADGLRLKLTAEGRTNSDTAREEWAYGGIGTEFEGFNWVGNGWTGRALRHTGLARTRVGYRPLQQPEANAQNAFTFLVKYRCTEVVDEGAPVISCVDAAGTGFVITPTEARMQTRGGGKLAMKMEAGRTYEVAFTSFPRAAEGAGEYAGLNAEMCYLYIDGKMSGGVQRGAGDSIYQSEPACVEMGSGSAALEVFLLRAYDTALTDAQLLACHTLDQDTADALLEEYAENDILDGTGAVDIARVPKGMRAVVVTGRQADGTPTLLHAAAVNDKSAKFDVDEILSFVPGGLPLQNFRCVGGCIRLQGTSSLAYPVKNYRFYFKDSGKVPGKFYLGCDEQGAGGELQEKAEFSFRPASEGQAAAAPVDCFCAKADFAESSSSHNTGMARLVQDTLAAVGDLVPPQAHVDTSRYAYDVRTTIDGEPCYLFYRATVEAQPVFLGKYNFNNDKSTEAVFGFLGIPGYHDAQWVQDKFSGENPTECWEFLNNDYPMGLFRDDDFDRKDEDGTPAWLKVFEARFPDDDGRNAEYEAGTRKPAQLEALVKWVRSTDTSAQGLTAAQQEARGKKFREELAQWFDVPYLCDYYMLTDLMACCDQRVKNMMMAFWYSPEAGRVLAYMIFYDNDTILGVRNDGRLKYGWDIDHETADPELSTPDKTVYAFAGHGSVLWQNLREQFPDELAAAYRRIRAKLTDEAIFSYFDTLQSARFCERIYNLDALSKYVRPKTLGVPSGGGAAVKYSYLESMQGDRKAHRHWFVTNRAGLFDARYSTGLYTATDLTFKGNSAAGATVKATAARDFYFEFRREGEAVAHEAVKAGAEWTYTYGVEANIGTIFHLLGGAWMSSIDLSQWGGFTDINFPRLPVLRRLVMGAAGRTYRLTELSFADKLPMLEELEMQNYVALPAIDLSGCTRLRRADFSGCTALSSASFAPGALLEELGLPAAFRTLVLRGMPLLERSGIRLAGPRSLTGLWVEGCAKLDGLALFRELFALSSRAIRYVRLPGLSLEGNGDDLVAWHEAGLGGLDAEGNPVEGRCKVGGTYRLTRYLPDELHAALSARFDELRIVQPGYTAITFHDAVADDANVSCPDNLTGYAYANAYQPCGHVQRILSRRRIVLGKQVAEGEMAVCRLHEADLNRYADASAPSAATPALLDGTEGDCFMLEPEYYYKGVNDPLGAFSGGEPMKYACFALPLDGELPPADGAGGTLTLTAAEIAAAGDELAGYALATGKINYASALVKNASYSVRAVPVEGWRYVRFPTVLGGTGLLGAMFADAAGDSAGDVLVRSDVQSRTIADGMYVIAAVPERAVRLHFTVMNKMKEEDEVVLSNSARPEDMEPRWVRHEACLTGLFQAVQKEGSPYSVAGLNILTGLTISEFEAYAAKRGLQLVDWEMHKDVGNLFFARYGRRNAQDTCGWYINNANPVTGITAFLGAADTVNKEGNSSGAWYEQGGVLMQLASVRCMGYENWYNGYHEWVGKADLPNTPAEDAGKYRIFMPDGTVRKAYSDSYQHGSFVRQVRHQRYMDTISVGDWAGAGGSTYYSDHQDRGAAEDKPIIRSHAPGYSAGGGVTSMNSEILRTYKSDYCTSRLAFRGTIREAGSVEAYKALQAIY